MFRSEFPGALGSWNEITREHGRDRTRDRYAPSPRLMMDDRPRGISKRETRACKYARDVSRRGFELSALITRRNISQR